MNNLQIIKQSDYNYSGGVIDKTVITTDSISYQYNQNNLPIEIGVSGSKYYPVKIDIRSSSLI